LTARMRLGKLETWRESCKNGRLLLTKDCEKART
jgi:hypothetical protein